VFVGLSSIVICLRSVILCASSSFRWDWK